VLTAYLFLLGPPHSSALSEATKHTRSIWSDWAWLRRRRGSSSLGTVRGGGVAVDSLTDLAIVHATDLSWTLLVPPYAKVQTDTWIARIVCRTGGSGLKVATIPILSADTGYFDPDVWFDPCGATLLSPSVEGSVRMRSIPNCDCAARGKRRQHD
jgi:hypothetical protein